MLKHSHELVRRLVSNMLCVAAVVAASLAALGVIAEAGDNLAAYATPPSVLPSPDLGNNIAVAKISGGTYAVVADLRVNPDILRDGNLTVAARVNVSIINITDPAAPAPVTSTSDDADGFTDKFRAISIAVSQISGGTYAVVGSASDTGVQIFNITDPAAPPQMVGQAGAAEGFANMARPLAVTISDISGGTYAVATHFLGGVQIFNVTDPAAPVLAAAITDNSHSIYRGYVELDEGFNVSISDTYGGTYALFVDNDGKGARIVNMTDPAAPYPMVELPDGVSVFVELGWPEIVSVSRVSGGIYAVVAGAYDRDIRVVNVTDPAAPSLVNDISYGAYGFTHLDGAAGIETVRISGGTYAVVASQHDRGVQVINVTDPAAPAPVVGITDDLARYPCVADPCIPLYPPAAGTIGDDGFSVLGGAFGVDVSSTPNGTYAVVASRHDHGMQIIDITDPANPSPVAGITDGTGRVATGYDVLSGAFDVAVSEICGGTYAVVASSGDSGLQIIDITDPANPSPAAGVTHEADGLVGPYVGGVKIAEISGRTYAVVASGNDSVRMVDITNPANPLSPSASHSAACADSG